MSESTERKLNMSLDDLVKKERAKSYRQHQHPDHHAEGPGPQRHGRQPMQGWPFRGGPQQPPQQQRMMNGNNAGAGRQGWGQQRHDMGGFQQDGPQRGSVFARLGADNQGGYPQQQPYPPQHHQQQGQYMQRGPPHGRQQQQQGHAGYMQQRQQQQQAPQAPPRPVKPKLRCDEGENGEAFLYHQDYLIIQVSPSGDMVLDSGNDHSPERRAAFNIALSHFNIAVREAPQLPGATAAAGGEAQPQWNVSEGHRLVRFADGMRVASRGPMTSNRAAVLLAAYGEHSGKAQEAAAAAQEASRQAAIAAGLLPGAAAGGAGAAAAAGGPEDAEAARVRRLKAQGRFMPY